MRRILSILIVLFSSCPGTVLSAEPTVTISPKWQYLNPDTKECGGFSEDSLVLKIKENEKEITHEFCSSYGKAHAEITKDVLGDNFLILKFGRGRGTNAVSEYLSVYRVAKNLIEYVCIPVSEGSGP